MNGINYLHSSLCSIVVLVLWIKSVDNKPFVWLPLNGSCITSKISLFFYTSPLVDRTRSAYLNCPKGYSTPSNIVLGYKKWSKGEGKLSLKVALLRDMLSRVGKGKQNSWRPAFADAVLLSINFEIVWNQTNYDFCLCLFFKLSSYHRVSVPRQKNILFQSTYVA